MQALLDERFIVNRDDCHLTLNAGVKAKAKKETRFLRFICYINSTNPYKAIFIENSSCCTTPGTF